MLLQSGPSARPAAPLDCCNSSAVSSHGLWEGKCKDDLLVSPKRYEYTALFRRVVDSCSHIRCMWTHCPYWTATIFGIPIHRGLPNFSIGLLNCLIWPGAQSGHMHRLIRREAQFLPRIGPGTLPFSAPGTAWPTLDVMA